jgi:RimJ/RimL family protein N-acetyltransferase
MNIIYAFQANYLIIRCFQKKDALSLKTIVENNTCHLQTYMSWLVSTFDTFDKTEQVIKNWEHQFSHYKAFNYAIFYKTTDKLLGHISVNFKDKKYIELGYWISSDELRKGIAYLAVYGVIYLMFVHYKCVSIQIRCNFDNIPSNKLAKKLGFELNNSIIKKLVSKVKSINIWELHKQNFFEVSNISIIY